MNDKMTELLDKYYDFGIFDKEYSKESLKCLIEEKIKTIKKNKNILFKRITDTGDTMAYYRYELLELDKLPIKTIRQHIQNGTFTYDMNDCREYTKKFNKYFKLQNRDTNFFNQFYSYLFEHRDDKNLYLETLIRDFYTNYTNTTKNGTNRVDVSDLTKLLHFIRRGDTPLYNKQYRDFFFLKDIGSLVDTSTLETPSDVREEKIKVFKQQYYFINSIFDEIINQSRPSSNKKSIYNYSDYFDSFIDKFYITDKGVTKHKMIDYGILYFN